MLDTKRNMQQIQLKRSRFFLVAWPVLLGFILTGALCINAQNFVILQQQPSRLALWLNTLLMDAAFIVASYFLFKRVIDFITIFTDDGLLRYYKGKRQFLAWAEVTELTLKNNESVLLKAPTWKISINRAVFAESGVMVEEIERHLSSHARIRTVTNFLPGCLWPFFWPLLFWLTTLIGNAVYPPSVPFARELMYGAYFAPPDADTKSYHRIKPHHVSPYQAYNPKPKLTTP